jgi:hypothetical protein
MTEEGIPMIAGLPEDLPQAFVRAARSAAFAVRTVCRLALAIGESCGLCALFAG